MTGTRKVFSSCVRVVRGNAADEERMKRSPCDSIVAPFTGARERIEACIVGTAEYHVGLNSANQSKKLGATNPGVQTTLPPDCSEASNEATSP